MGKKENIQRWKEMILESVDYIKEEKEKDCISPTNATNAEIINLVQERVKFVTGLLVRSGELKEQNTLNGKIYKRDE